MDRYVSPKRIGRLHDDLEKAMAAYRMLSEKAWAAAARYVEPGESRDREAFGRLREVARASLSEARNLVCRVEGFHDDIEEFREKGAGIWM
ncbi:MAG: histidine kinase [Deltaproteobacteria bacterium]|jgi:signal transduction histidine kinase|nr:histidine kinase [Deltaproteobacteria bacterium]